MYSNNRKIKYIIFGAVVLISVMATFITLRIQSHHTQSKMPEVVTTMNKNATKKKNTKTKTADTKDTTNTPKNYIQPVSNSSLGDAQVTTVHQYNSAKTGIDTSLIDKFTVSKALNQNYKGINLIVLYTPNVKSDNDISDTLSYWQENALFGKYPITVWNLEKDKMTDNEFNDYLNDHSEANKDNKSNKKADQYHGGSLPNQKDIYAIAIKNNVIYDYIYKTDKVDSNSKTLNNFNHTNVENVFKALSKVK